VSLKRALKKQYSGHPYFSALFRLPVDSKRKLLKLCTGNQLFGCPVKAEDFGHLPDSAGFRESLIRTTIRETWNSEIPIFGYPENTLYFCDLSPGVWVISHTYLHQVSNFWIF